MFRTETLRFDENYVMKLCKNYTSTQESYHFVNGLSSVVRYLYLYAFHAFKNRQILIFLLQITLCSYSLKVQETCTSTLVQSLVIHVLEKFVVRSFSISKSRTATVCIFTRINLRHRLYEYSFHIINFL